MPVTLTDEQVAALRADRDNLARRAAVGDRATQIWNHPKASDRAKALWKEVFPDEPIADYDLEQRVNARLDADRKEREEEKRKAREAELDQTIGERRKAVRERYQFTDDGMKELEDYMIARGIQNHEDAAELMAARRPQPVDDNTGSGHYWNHDKQDQFKKVVNDPEGWGFEEIHKAVVNDARSRGLR
jgi:hypothetical protein